MMCWSLLSEAIERLNKGRKRRTEKRVAHGHLEPDFDRRLLQFQTPIHLGMRVTIIESLANHQQTNVASVQCCLHRR